ncbi:MAG: hypothetical protein ABI689_12730 [Thermoanaerobaculia bacterium]
MKRQAFGALLGTTLLMLAVGAAGAEELTVHSILAAQQSGARADGMIAMVRSPANTVAMTAGDLVTLRDAGVPENVISVIWAFLPTPAPAPVALEPDDSRLVDIVRLIDSGTSEQNIAEQVRQSGKAYNLSVNDLVYLKKSGARESTIAALLATPGATAPVVPAVAPSEVVLDGLVMMKRGFLRKDRTGSLVMRGNSLAWEDSGSQSHNFTFEATGLEKVWFTCEARSSGNFCHQINFQIVKGDRYRFRDAHGDSGSNAAVLKVMETLRTYLPRITYATPDVAD